MRIYRGVLCLITVLFAVQAYSDNSNNSENRSLEDLSNIPLECVGKEFCLIQPIDYPTEDIERIAKNLQKRWKRHNFIHAPQSQDINNGDPNNCATSSKIAQPYLIIRNQLKHFVIQSKFFKQTFPIVTCKKENARCFEDLLLPAVRACCRTKYAYVSLIAYDPSNSRVEQIESQFPVDCGCDVYE